VGQGVSQRTLPLSLDDGGAGTFGGREHRICVRLHWKVEKVGVGAMAEIQAGGTAEMYSVL
jgi:hypothetical protein